MSQDKTLPSLPAPDVLEAGYEPGTPPDAYSAAAVLAYGERCIAAHLERAGQSVTNDAWLSSQQFAEQVAYLLETSDCLKSSAKDRAVEVIERMYALQQQLMESA